MDLDDSKCFTPNFERQEYLERQWPIEPHRTLLHTYLQHVVKCGVIFIPPYASPSYNFLLDDACEALVPEAGSGMFATTPSAPCRDPTSNGNRPAILRSIVRRPLSARQCRRKATSNFKGTPQPRLAARRCGETNKSAEIVRFWHHSIAE